MGGLVCSQEASLHDSGGLFSEVGGCRRPPSIGWCVGGWHEEASSFEVGSIGRSVLQSGGLLA